MGGISQFSTPENFAKVSDAIDQLQTAIDEANLAVQAGIPNADATLKSAQQALARANQFKQVYFPAGAPE